MAKKTIGKVERKRLKRLPTVELQRKQRVYLESLSKVLGVARWQAQNFPARYFKESQRQLYDIVEALAEVENVLQDRTDLKAGPLAVA